MSLEYNSSCSGQNMDQLPTAMHDKCKKTVTGFDKKSLNTVQPITVLPNDGKIKASQSLSHLVTGQKDLGHFLEPSLTNRNEQLRPFLRAYVTNCNQL